MAVPVTLTIAGQKYQILFGANALRQLEKASGYSIQTIGLMLVTGRGGFGLLQEALWAGLEGARAKINPKQPSLTVEDVGDIIDEHPGGLQDLWDEDSPNSIMKPFMEAWSSAFPVKRKDEKKVDPPPAEDVPPKELTSGGTT